MPMRLEESLQRDIDLIRSKIIEMGRLAEQALETSLAAINERNRQYSYSVILRDRYIDELEKELDRLCLEFFVRQHPAAGHLRFVYAAIKINNELERVGDYAESIARQYLVLSAIDHEPSYPKITEIANLAIPMLRNAILAFVEKDPEVARETMRLEERVNEIRASIHNELVAIRDKKKIPLKALPPLMIIASRFERVADQACNICEEVLYMCTGEMIKHKGAEVFRILFIDETNSCVSQMAEAIGNSLGLERFVFSSAGLAPETVDPGTIDFMREKGMDISHATSKYMHQILHLEHYEIIVALCKAAEKELPGPPTKTIGICWDVKDPSKQKGSMEERRAAYAAAYDFLELHIRDLVQAVLGDRNDTGQKEEVK